MLWEVLPIDWATDWTKARHGINEVVIVNEENYDPEEEEEDWGNYEDNDLDSEYRMLL